MNTPRRHRHLNKCEYEHGPIIYWMSRDQRVNDNWALLYAIDLAKKYKTELHVVFSLRPNLQTHFGTARMLDFMLEGLQLVEKDLAALNIPFHFVLSDPEDGVKKCIKKLKAGAVVSDFSPLVVNRSWKQALVKELPIPLIDVDAHNILPAWQASSKQEFAAYTFRPKVHKLLPEYLTEFPHLEPLSQPQVNPVTNWQQIRQQINVDENVTAVAWLKSGERAARDMLFDFIDHRLEKYDQHRNDPNADAQSNVSPYLHFGQIASQRVALEIQKAKVGQKNIDAFLEELIVRKELSDNFCLYNAEYKSVAGFPNWANESHQAHRSDPREHLYNLEDLEQAHTHDPLWNASQLEMVINGKMHGYLRMYWAKKILEWTKNPEQAMEYAIYLNDKYSLDGRDPNGYTGIAWSIGGVHDRPWFERPIFGKIRFMNYNGAKRKFDVGKYIQSINELAKKYS